MINNMFLDAVLSLVAHCGLCDKVTNGKALPYVGASAKAILFGEAPGKEEATSRTPFVGKSGQLLFKVFNKYGYTREDFVIVNTIQCRPVLTTSKGVRNGKPTKNDMLKCSPFVEAILFGSGLEHIMCLGSYPKQWISIYKGDSSLDKTPMGRIVGETHVLEVVKPVNKMCTSNISVTYNFHPAALLYDKSKISIFENTIKKFINLVEG